MQDIVPRKSIRDIEKPKHAPENVSKRLLSDELPTFVPSRTSVATPEVKAYNHQEYGHKESVRDDHGGRAWQYIFACIAVGLILVGAYLHFNKRVSVFVTPHTAVVTLQNTPIEILAKDILTIEESKEVKVPIVSTGTKQVESKAQGTATIFNTGSQAQVLVATTRLQTSKGNVYRVGERVTVPAAKSGVPGSVEARITADAPGPSYNVSNVDLTLPGLAGSPRFKQVYARVSKGVQGGASEAVPQFDQSIVDKVIAEAVELSKKDLVIRITARVPASVQILKETAWTVNRNIASSTAFVTVIGKALAIEQSVLATYIANEKQLLALSQGAVFADIQKKSIDGFELTAKGGRVRMSGDVRLQSQILTDEIQKILTDKSFNQFSAIMKNVNGSKESRFTARPFWIQSFPDVSRIEVIIE